MIDDHTKQVFIDSANEWVCDGYSASIRFIAGAEEQEFFIWEATITLSPLPPKADNSFYVQSKNIFLGQIDLISSTKKDLLQYIDNAALGSIETPMGPINLPAQNKFSHYSEASQRDRWFCELHLGTSGSQRRNTRQSELPEIDNFLRLSTPPFDGLQDAATWLGLSGSFNDNRNSTIDIRISPPVDLIFSESSLKNDKFNVVLHAHPHFDTELVQVAVRGTPGDNLKTRLQISRHIKWGQAEDSKCIGEGQIEVRNSDNILAILMIGNSTVRRQWFSDSGKARNNRLLAVQNFDTNLKMTKHAVLESADAPRFENGIAALLFLLGFSPCVQLETDSPDLIVQAPDGRLILVECTIKTSDFSSKIGKLVDRRGSLVKQLGISGHYNAITSILVCRLPRDQIAAHQEELTSHKTILITQENLIDYFDQIRHHIDPEKILDDLELTLKDDSQVSFPL